MYLGTHLNLPKPVSAHVLTDTPNLAKPVSAQVLTDTPNPLKPVSAHVLTDTPNLAKPVSAHVLTDTRVVEEVSVAFSEAVFSRRDEDTVQTVLREQLVTGRTRARVRALSVRTAASIIIRVAQMFSVITLSAFVYICKCRSIG